MLPKEVVKNIVFRFSIKTTEDVIQNDDLSPGIYSPS